MANDPRATLLMLSGGPCSLSVLIDLLENTDDRVFVHHVQLKARGKDSAATASRCQQIVDYCSFNLRPFEYSQSFLDYGEFSIDGIEPYCAATHAALAGLSYQITHQDLDRCIIAGTEAQRDDSASAEHLRNSYLGASYADAPVALERSWIDDDSARARVPESLANLVGLA